MRWAEAATAAQQSGPDGECSAAGLISGAKVSCHLGMKPEGKPGIQKISTCSSLEVEGAQLVQPVAAPLRPTCTAAPKGVWAVASTLVESHQYLGWSSKYFWEGPGPKAKLIQECPLSHQFFHPSSALVAWTERAFQRQPFPQPISMSEFSAPDPTSSFRCQTSLLPFAGASSHMASTLAPDLPQ